MTKNHPDQHIGAAMKAFAGAGALTIILTLGGCDEMTRFKQEKYECGLNKAGVYEVLFRSMDVGDEATLSTNQGEEMIPIVFSDESAFILERPGMILRIDRGSGGIKVTRGTTYRNLRCSKSVFKM